MVSAVQQPTVGRPSEPSSPLERAPSGGESERQDMNAEQIFPVQASPAQTPQDASEDMLVGAWLDGELTEAELTAAQDWLLSTEDFKGVAPLPVAAFADLAPLEATLAKIGPADPSILPTR